ncbi:MarR family transcriptional regulator [Emcibacter sp.]|uniref:MarR family winged helix-turn-helix transcriptional regulator n=1 Tax=Emcibacter sp. TaxID=1979954 RepID=UPI002AA77707|nr:MarR family transcriptional regulator [Emcibacter sp.]
MDHVDKIIEQWKRERPDLDVGPMELIGRVKRISQHLSRGMEKNYAAHGLTASGFDVLATLRRSGKPYALSPGDLMAATMVTSGTMTNRIDQLAKEGLVERIRSEEDKRSFLISLTEKGGALIDKVLQDHVITQQELVAGLSEKERVELNELLKVFLSGFEGREGSSGSTEIDK